jgi:hypothetical protein
VKGLSKSAVSKEEGFSTILLYKQRTIIQKNKNKDGENNQMLFRFNRFSLIMIAVSSTLTESSAILP